jgi:hypothetical protein
VVTNVLLQMWKYKVYLTAMGEADDKLPSLLSNLERMSVKFRHTSLNANKHVHGTPATAHISVTPLLIDHVDDQIGNLFLISSFMHSLPRFNEFKTS